MVNRWTLTFVDATSILSQIIKVTNETKSLKQQQQQKKQKKKTLKGVN